MYYLKDITTNHEILITSWIQYPFRDETFVEFSYDGAGCYGAWVDLLGNFNWLGKKFNINDFCEV